MTKLKPHAENQRKKQRYQCPNCWQLEVEFGFTDTRAQPNKVKAMPIETDNSKHSTILKKKYHYMFLIALV